MKRLIDILLSSVALIILAPVLIPVACILRCTGPRRVFYRQERVGEGGRIFRVYKFVTMVEGSESMSGGLLTQKNDPRVVPFGRILRATKINEIPQLVNVLLGDMSIIGPRPQVQPQFDMFPEHVRKEIIKVRPGLSGIGSIVFRDEESILAKSGKEERQFYAQDITPYKGELELWYIQHQSLVWDLLLMLLTVWVVLFPKTRCLSLLFNSLPEPSSSVLAQCLGLVRTNEGGTPRLSAVPMVEERTR